MTNYPHYNEQQYQQQPMVNMNNVNISVNTGKSGPGFLVRCLWFCCIGWWLGYLMLWVGFSFCALVVTLPIGLMILNRLPRVMTLKAAGTQTSVNVATAAIQQQGMMVNTTNVNVSINGTRQVNGLARAVYFICIGSWAGLLWAHLAYICCATLVLLPVGVLMFEKLPAVLTLRRN